MRDINRIPEILAIIQEGWEKVPDWRLGQLISNFYAYAGRDLFYTEDDKYIEIFKNFMQEIEKG